MKRGFPQIQSCQLRWWELALKTLYTRCRCNTLS